MKKNYTVLCLFKLKPVYFYLLLNFLDLIYNNFNMNEKLIEKSNKTFLKIEIIILTLTNNLNSIMVVIAIGCYFYYIYTQNYRTLLHKTYVYSRFTICFCRSVIFFFTFFFYCSILMEAYDILGVYYNLILSFFLMYLEINNIIWCFWLKDVIFFKEPQSKNYQTLNN
jgi:hypothetical protein